MESGELTLTCFHYDFPLFTIDDVDVNGGDVVTWVVPVDGVTGFCGK
jgi:hypothetical protein